MKTLLLLLLLPICASAQITSKTDQFTGATTLSGERTRIPNTAGHKVNGIVLHTNDETVILLFVVNNRWVHLSDRTAYAIMGADQTRMDIEMFKAGNETDYTNSSLRTIEAIGLTIKSYDIQEPLLVRIGSNVYTMPSSVITDIKEIGRLITKP